MIKPTIAIVLLALFVLLHITPIRTEPNQKYCDQKFRIVLGQIDNYKIGHNYSDAQLQTLDLIDCEQNSTKKLYLL